MDKILSGNDTIRLTLTLVAAIAALNWGLVEFIEYDLLVDLLSLEGGTTTYRGSMGVITASAAVTAWNTVAEVLD